MVNGRQIRAARAWAGISQEKLSKETGVDRKTIAAFEQGRSFPHPRTRRDLQLHFEQMGVEFLFEGEIGVGFRARAEDVDEPGSVS
jgi:DNA-binding XRE family transcriptional regulator